MEQEAHDTLHCWTATDDAPAPVGSVEAGRPLTVVVGVQPMDADAMAYVGWRVDGGEVRVVGASRSFVNATARVRYHVINLPVPDAGSVVEYGAICTPAGEAARPSAQDFMVAHRLEVVEPANVVGRDQRKRAAAMAARFAPGESLRDMTAPALLAALGHDLGQVTDTTGDVSAESMLAGLRMSGLPSRSDASAGNRLSRPSEDGATLAAFARLSLLTDDARTVGAMVGGGYQDIAEIASVPPPVFAGTMADVLPAVRSRDLHSLARAQMALAANVIAAVRGNAATGISQPAHFERAAAALGDGLDSACRCADCDSALGPRAYLADLVGYALQHLEVVAPGDEFRDGEPRSLSIAELSVLTCQPLLELLGSCESVTAEVRRVRLVCEALWRRYRAWMDYPVPADVACSLSFGVSTRHALAADIDNDGQDELIVIPVWSTELQQRTGLYVMRYDAEARRWQHFGSDRDPTTMIDVRLDSAHFADVGFALAADVDGDGADEIILYIAEPVGVSSDPGTSYSRFWVLDYDLSTKTWHHLNGGAVLRDSADFECTAKSSIAARSAVAADVDGDGRAEIVVALAAEGAMGNCLWVMDYNPFSSEWRRLTTIAGHPHDASVQCSDLEFPAKYLLAGRFDHTGPRGNRGFRDGLAVAIDYGQQQASGRDYWILYYDDQVDPLTGSNWTHLLWHGSMVGTMANADADSGWSDRGTSTAVAWRASGENLDSLMVAGYGGATGADPADPVVLVRHFDWASLPGPEPKVQGTWSTVGALPGPGKPDSVGVARILPLSSGLDAEHDAAVILVPGPRWDGDRQVLDGSWIVQRRVHGAAWEVTGPSPIAANPRAFVADVDGDHELEIVIPHDYCRLSVYKYVVGSREWVHLDNLFGDMSNAVSALYLALLPQFGASWQDLRNAQVGDIETRQNVAEQLGIAVDKDGPQPDRLEKLTLDPASVDGPTLERLFGMQDMTRDPFSTGVVIADPLGCIGRWQVHNVDAAGPFANVGKDGELHVRIGSVHGQKPQVEVRLYLDPERQHLIAEGRAPHCDGEKVVAVPIEGLVGTSWGPTPLRGYFEIRLDRLPSQADAEAAVSVVPSLLRWRLDRLRELWRSEGAPSDGYPDGMPTEPDAEGKLPIIDPDLIGPGDIVVPVAATHTPDSDHLIAPYDMWLARRIWVDHIRKDVLGSQPDLPAMLARMRQPLDAFGVVPWGVDAPTEEELARLRHDLAASGETERAMRAGALIRSTLKLEPGAFLRLEDIRAKHRLATERRESLSPSEMDEAAAILTSAVKATVREDWRREEETNRIALDGLQFSPASQSAVIGSWPDNDGTEPLIDPDTVPYEELLEGLAGTTARMLWDQRASVLRERLYDLKEASYRGFAEMAHLSLPQAPPSGHATWAAYISHLADRLDTEGESGDAASEIRQAFDVVPADFQRISRSIALLESHVPVSDAQLDAVCAVLTRRYKKDTLQDEWVREEDRLGLWNWTAYRLHLEPWVASAVGRSTWVRAFEARQSDPIVDPDIVTKHDLRYKRGGAHMLWSSRQDWLADLRSAMAAWRLASPDVLVAIDEMMVRCLYGTARSYRTPEDIEVIALIVGELGDEPTASTVAHALRCIGDRELHDLSQMLAASQSADAESTRNARMTIAWQAGMTANELDAILSVSQELEAGRTLTAEDWRRARKTLARALALSPLLRLERDRQAGRLIGSRLAAVGLSWSTYRSFVNLRDRLAIGADAGQSDWETVEDIAIGILKYRLRGSWTQAERGAGVTHSPDHFVEIGEDDDTPAVGTVASRTALPGPTHRLYLGEPDRAQWLDTLRDHRDQALSEETSYRQALSEAEEAVLPPLLAALITALPLDVGTFAERAAWLKANVGIAADVGGCELTTRLADALLSLQDLMLRVRSSGGVLTRLGLRYAGPLSAVQDASDQATVGHACSSQQKSSGITRVARYRPARSAFGFDADWEWMGSYAAWKSAMFVFLYPENIARPELKTTMSPQFEELRNEVLAGETRSPEGAKQTASRYADAMRAISGNHEGFLVRTTTKFYPTDGQREGEAHEVEYLIRLDPTSSECYWIWHDFNKDTFGYWSRLEAVSGSDIKLVGAVLYQPTTAKDPRIYLFLMEDRPRDYHLKMAVFDIRNGVWSAQAEELSLGSWTPPDRSDSVPLRSSDSLTCRLVATQKTEAYPWPVPRLYVECRIGEHLTRRLVALNEEGHDLDAKPEKEFAIHDKFQQLGTNAPQLPRTTSRYVALDVNGDGWDEIIMCSEHILTVYSYSPEHKAWAAQNHRISGLQYNGMPIAATIVDMVAGHFSGKEVVIASNRRPRAELVIHYRARLAIQGRPSQEINGIALVAFEENGRLLVEAQLADVAPKALIAGRFTSDALHDLIVVEDDDPPIPWKDRQQGGFYVLSDSERTAIERACYFTAYRIMSRSGVLEWQLHSRRRAGHPTAQKMAWGQYHSIAYGAAADVDGDGRDELVLGASPVYLIAPSDYDDNGVLRMTGNWCDPHMAPGLGRKVWVMDWKEDQWRNLNPSPQFGQSAFDVVNGGIQQGYEVEAGPISVAVVAGRFVTPSQRDADAPPPTPEEQQREIIERNRQQLVFLSSLAVDPFASSTLYTWQFEPGQLVTEVGMAWQLVAAETPGCRPTRMFSGDIDGDGVDELILSCDRDPAIWVGDYKADRWTFQRERLPDSVPTARVGATVALGGMSGSVTIDTVDIPKRFFLVCGSANEPTSSSHTFRGKMKPILGRRENKDDQTYSFGSPTDYSMWKDDERDFDRNRQRSAVLLGHPIVMWWLPVPEDTPAWFVLGTDYNPGPHSVRAATPFDCHGRFDRSVARRASELTWFENCSRIMTGAATMRRIYVEEALFFAPCLIAHALQEAGEYQAALDWWRTVFDYTVRDSESIVYFGLRPETQPNDWEERSHDWLADPLNPHTLAATRPGVYQRYVLLAICECLLEYADSEYAVDTSEGLTRARDLYGSALALFQSMGALSQTEGRAESTVLAGSVIGHAADALARGMSPRDPNGNRAPLPSIPHQLASSSHATLLSAAHFQLLRERSSLSHLNVGAVPLQSLALCVPPNAVVSARIERARTGLAKLAECRAFNGMRRQVAFYPVPIDATSGLPTVGPGGQLQLPLLQRYRPSPYRFAFLIQRAKELVHEAGQLEDKVLRLYESRDEQERQSLALRHDLRIRRAAVRLNGLMEREAADHLRRSELQVRRMELDRLQLGNLITAGNLSAEDEVITFQRLSQTLSFASAALSVVSAFAENNGKSKFGSLAQAASSVGAGFGVQAQISSTMAGYERRAQEWRTRLQQTLYDTVIARQEIAVARDRLAVATMQRTIADIEEANATELANYLTTKFTGPGLYVWMLSIVPQVYRYLLREATSAAQAAAGQLSFELQETPPAIQADYWAPPSRVATSGMSSDTKGLTGSTRLLNDVTALEQFGIDHAGRKLHMTKVISLAQLAPLEFQRFTETGIMSFATPMALFDRDHPGQYMRLIRRVRADVVAIVPRTEGVHGMLSCTGVSRVVVGGDVFQTIVVHRDPESVALSTLNGGAATDDSESSRTMNAPFEWQGVDTSWELRMPKASNQIDYESIADVLLSIEYSALDSYEYYQTVTKQLDRRFTADRVFSVRSDLPDSWYDLHHPDETGEPMKIRFAIDAGDFPSNVDQLRIQHLLLYFAGRGQSTVNVDYAYLRLFPTDQPYALGGRASPIGGVISTRRGNASSLSVLQGKSPFGTWELEVPDTEEMRMQLDRGDISDILLVISFRGTTPAWPT